MSTKASKKAAAATPSGAGNVKSSQPTTSTPIGRRPGSPLSPTRHSRLQEKQDLQNLNDRLACYIDRVRHLESENSKLTREVQTTQESVTREVYSIKAMYERELSDARKLLDDTAKERAKLEIDTKRLWVDNEDLQETLKKKTEELQAAEKNGQRYEMRLNDLQTQFNQCEAERKKLADRGRELEDQVVKLKALFEDARKHLEEETLQRIDLENNIQSLKEECTFKDQVYQQELSETRTRRQVEISEIDGRLAEQYEAQLQQSLQEWRDQYEAQMRANREEIEVLYENKIKNLTSHAQRNSTAASLAVEEMRTTRAKLDGLNQRINELENANNALNVKIRDLEMLRENERVRHTESLSAVESELARMRDEMAQQLQEYQDLMDIKVALDSEIAAYRKLLESEEARLNITPLQTSSMTTASGKSTPSRRTPVRGGKRKRTLLEENEERRSSDYMVTRSARGDVEITKDDPSVVMLTNKGDKEIALAEWRIVRTAGAAKAVYHFEASKKLEPGRSITVHPGEIGDSPDQFLSAESITTSLFNNKGEEVATSIQKKHQVSSSVSRHTENLVRRSSTSKKPQSLEEIHHQQGDPKGEEHCRLM